MNDKITTIKNLIHHFWVESPWVRAAGILGSTIAGLMFLNTVLPIELSIDVLTLKNPEVKPIILTFIVVLYFFLAAIFSGDKLKFEQKLRALEQSFRYDNRGTLYNGSEPNIAFRIATFKGILEGISGAIGANQLANVLSNTGRLAGNDFARSLKNIYNGDVASQQGKLAWDELSLNEKLNQWAEYDSATGWGILTCDLQGNCVKVVINHLRGLFDGNGGLMFGYFLGGYSETVLSHCVNNHSIGKYAEYGKAELTNTNQTDKYTLELEYQLK